MPNLDAAAAAPASPHDPIRLLLRAGKNDEAIVRLCGIVITSPGDREARELLFDAFFQKRDWAPALALIQQLVAERPDNALSQRSLIATLSNMKRFDEAIALATRYVESHGENLMVLDALKVAHFYSGRVNEAIRYGQYGLTLRDRESLQTPLPFALTEPSGPPAGSNVISYSLWGPAPFYGYGAMINLVQSRTVYPGWSCRFYIDAAVPKACASFLRDNGADVRMIEDEYPGVGLFQRFLVMNDASVGRFLVRDCDARLSQPEADLIAQWIDSGQPFHVVRDHVLHNELMIGCLWAGRTDCGIDIVDLMRRYFTFGPTAKYGHDQRMLGLMLWPLIREHCLVHDKYYRLDGIETRPLPDPNSQFGAGRQNIETVLREVEQYGIPRVF
jgi:tetratricopeptide (TPR) repeat protein